MSELRQMIQEYWEHLTVLALLNMALIVVVIPVVLLKKRDPTTAVAWCLIVLLVPMLGALLFWGFGVNYLQRRVKHKRQQRLSLRAAHWSSTSSAPTQRAGNCWTSWPRRPAPACRCGCSTTRPGRCGCRRRPFGP
jgi:hypothetical protein